MGLSCSVCAQLLANAPRKTADNGPSAWVPATSVGGPAGVPGSWLRPASDLAVAASRRMFQQMEGIFPSLSLLFYISDKRINTLEMLALGLFWVFGLGVFSH